MADKKSVKRSDWSDCQEIALGHLGALRKGVNFNFRQEGVGIPVVKVKDFGSRISIQRNDLEKLDELDNSRISVSKKQLLHKDDIVIIRSNGNSERLGQSMIYRGPDQAATLTSCCIRFRPDTERVDPFFMAYYLRSATFRQRLSMFGCGTGIQNLSQRVLSEMPVPLPPLGQQRAMARALIQLDRKIELNQKMNGTLEAIVAAIFKSWFVDFDPVQTKLGGRKSILNELFVNLFPDRLIESELGDIPEGWQVQPIREIIDNLLDSPRPHASLPKSVEGPLVLELRNLIGTQLDLTDIQHISDKHWLRLTEKAKPECGDIVFSYEGILGRFVLLPPDLRCCLGRRLALIKPRKSDPFRYFLFHTFTSAPFQRLLMEHSTHNATVKRLSLRDFTNHLIVWPTARARSVFDDIAELFWAVIHKNQKESHSLATIRDTLLPGMLSGEIRLPSGN